MAKARVKNPERHNFKQVVDAEQVYRELYIDSERFVYDDWELEFVPENCTPPLEELRKGPEHYTKHAIQPVDFIAANNLDYFQGNVIKYIVRFRDKDGKKDLLKAKHYIDLLIEREYGNEV